MRFLRTGRGRVGLVILAIVLFIALFGPFFARYNPAAIVGAPGQPPGNGYPLGTDYLGHDVLSRVLWGGRSVLWLSLAATGLAYITGSLIGLIAGYNRNFLDPLLMRSMDVILVFPPLLFFLIAATAVGTSKAVLIIGVAIVQAPGVSRIVYSATRETSVRGYVEAAVARGESTSAILRREIVPNIMAPMIANFGLSLTFSILLVAAVNFLNLGLQPPSANWALMISENRPVLSLNVWSTIAPAAMIAGLTIGVNLVGDAISHMLGRSEEVESEAIGTSAPQPLSITPMDP
jgi:ABC-type dipeptide/oligopeptide/nickel transport system permease subunit